MEATAFQGNRIKKEEMVLDLGREIRYNRVKHKNNEVEKVNAKKPIVCLATMPWSKIPHRTQQIMCHLKGVEILYFSYPDAKVDTPHKKKVKPNITVYVMPKDVRKVSDSQLFFNLSQKRLAQYILHTMARQHIRNPVLWLTHPTQEEMSCYLHYHTLVYDYFHDKNNQFEVSQEYLMRKSDLIFASSTSLKQELSTSHRNVAVLENGVNYSLFEEASIFARLDPTEKRLGFAGIIDPDLDLAPLIYMAKLRPTWKFLLLGPCPRGNPYLAQLKRMSNVVFYGEHPVHVVPEFLFSCHVLLDFRRFEQSKHHIHSTRMYEYFSTGRPVVTQNWQNDIEYFPDVVYTAYNQEEYIQLCQLALQEKEGSESLRRKNYAKKASWKRRGEQVLNVLTKAGLM